MKRLVLLPAVILLSLLSISPLRGQSTDYLTRAYEFINKEHGLDQKAIGELKIKDQYRTEHNQVEHVYLVQTFKGVEVLGTNLNLAFLPDGRIFGSSHNFMIMDGIEMPSENPAITAAEAIGISGKELGISSRAIPEFVRYTAKGLPVYSKADISHQDIPATLGYMRTSYVAFH